MRCDLHCPKPAVGSGLLVVVLAAAAAVGLAVAFIVAHALVLTLGAAGVLAVTGCGIWSLRRYATIVYAAAPLRAPRASRKALPLPSFAELAERQAPAISQRHVITATVISRTEDRTHP
ncbi:MAG: hypothetical protein ACLQDY_08900 [Streptosporangiaceae bacterium]